MQTEEQIKTGARHWLNRVTRAANPGNEARNWSQYYAIFHAHAQHVTDMPI